MGIHFQSDIGMLNPSTGDFFKFTALQHIYPQLKLTYQLSNFRRISYEFPEKGEREC